MNCDWIVCILSFLPTPMDWKQLSIFEWAFKLTRFAREANILQKTAAFINNQLQIPACMLNLDNIYNAYR